MDEHDLAAAFVRVRAATEALCAPLAVEDYVVQSMPDASPAKWHLAHTSWFFEELLLVRRPGYRPFDPTYRYLFNSYYESVGPHHERPARGLLSRPTVAETMQYRRAVDEAVLDGLPRLGDDERAVLVLGMHHEQQHQELLLTDLQHAFWLNPLRPAYRDDRKTRDASCVSSLLANHQPAASIASEETKDRPPRRSKTPEPAWRTFPEGLFAVGHDGRGFGYDNEFARHRVFLNPFALATRLVTCGDWLAFMDDGGYRRVGLWLSDGWAAAQAGTWRAPLYWERGESGWWQFTLSGMRPVEPAAPVCHVSYYEADAFSRWAGARLPTEEEWERAAAGLPVAGNFVERGALHPLAGGASPFGDVWQWTRSAYLPYPGFRPLPGPLGEYNGKFMCNQQVLRGGSCASPRDHLRATYRNYFPPSARWQFTGVRLARDE